MSKVHERKCIFLDAVAAPMGLIEFIVHYEIELLVKYGCDVSGEAASPGLSDYVEGGAK